MIWRITPLLLLAGCAEVGSSQLGSPLVLAGSGATTSLTVIACPTNPNQVAALQDVVTMLSSHGLLVTAARGGNARLVINSCPNGIPPADVIRAIGENQRMARR